MLPRQNDSSDKMKVVLFLHPVVAIKNTEKVVENITCGDGEDVEHITSKALQRIHV